MNFTKEHHAILIDWIKRFLIPIKSINSDIDTSDIREAFTQTYIKAFYLDNETINEAMLELGYHTSNFTSAPYLCFNVSSQSPAFRLYREWISNPIIFQKYK